MFSIFNSSYFTCVDCQGLVMGTARKVRRSFDFYWNFTFTSHGMCSTKEAWMGSPDESWSARSDFILKKSSSLICILIFSAIFLIICLWAVTMWHHEDGASIDKLWSSKKTFITKIYNLMWSRDSLESSNSSLFMNFLCNFTCFFSRSKIYCLMILRTPKHDTNELISYSLAREGNVFMVIALHNSTKKPN